MRLTKKNNGYHFPKKYEKNKNVSKHQVIHKLGSYEDSGYTPEELLLCSNPPEVLYVVKKRKGFEEEISPVYPLARMPLTFVRASSTEWNGIIYWNCEDDFHNSVIFPLMGLDKAYFFSREEAVEYIETNEKEENV